MAFTPIALASLGASLNALPTAAGVTGRHAGHSPKLMVLKGIVITSTAALRLYCYDSELLRWVPSEKAAQTVDPSVDGGVFEIRVNTAEIAGLYALVQESGTGVVSYVFRPGQN